MTKSAPDMKLRISPALRQRIEDAARTNNRTMNSEIISRLEFSFAVELTVQETGWDVGHGLDSPEMKAALMRERLGSGQEKAGGAYTRGEALSEFTALRQELDELKLQVSELRRYCRETN
jgi:hypothetical protein